MTLIRSGRLEKKFNADDADQKSKSQKPKASFFISGEVFAFPITAMSAIPRDHGDSAALCLRTSAIDPPPIDVLLKTKVKPRFDSPMTERSKPLFSIFKGSNRGQFQPYFPVFTVRSAEGRNTAMRWLFAKC